MPWSRTKSEERIRNALTSVPKSAVTVESFESRYSGEVHQRVKAAREGRRLPPVLHVPPSSAVVVDGVHVYIQLIGYNKVLTDTVRETEQRHQRALQFLHTHYSACDRIIEEYEVQRVDFHGSRLHAVVATPTAPQSERERVERALDFAQAIARMVEITGQRTLNGEFETGTRIGIDTGRAIAVNSGRGGEPEPLFLGSPANYAAKLAEGDEPGIFLSDRARRVLSLPTMGSLQKERANGFQGDHRDGFFTVSGVAVPIHRSISDESMELMSESVKQDVELRVRTVQFRFHHHQPPLRTIDFAKLSPSNTIHMPLTSIFADIDGFTRYVDMCAATGRVSELVSNLHAIRYELGAALRQDFGGRKVRFIGDCLHGLLAEGTAHATDEADTVQTSVMCAGGLRSSFELCQEMLPGIGELGLAIGIELGPTPVTRLGIRGDMSVRCATSKAVSASEQLQSGCTGSQTVLGPRALKAAPRAVANAFGQFGIMEGLTYDAATAYFLPAPAIAASSGKAEFLPHMVVRD